MSDYRVECEKFTSGGKERALLRGLDFSSEEDGRDGVLGSGLGHLVRRTWLSSSTHRKSPSLKEATCLPSSMAITMSGRRHWRWRRRASRRSAVYLFNYGAALLSHRAIYPDRTRSDPLRGLHYLDYLDGWAWGRLVQDIQLIDAAHNLVRVCTAFLGVDVNFGDGAPVLFETVVFGGPYDWELYRYLHLGRSPTRTCSGSRALRGT